jgi:hypothetical protein
MFSDEVWAYGGAHTQSYVTVKEDGSDRLDPTNMEPKYSQLPSWMFHGTIIGGRKGPGIFWEKEWGSIDAEKYDEHVLALVEQFSREQEERGRQPIFMQDNAPAHRAKITKVNLARRRIRWIQWPPYSPDLNLIEHVWKWMKDWIQEHYLVEHWNPERFKSRAGQARLRGIIQEAWDAVPQEYLDSLYSSWYRRCQAVIDAEGGPTKY